MTEELVSTVPCFSCSHCNFMTFNEVDLKRHQKEHTKTNSYLCPACDKGFNSLAAMRSHYVYNHDNNQGNFICPYEGCGKRFVGSHPLRIHMIIHTDAKPFACDHENCTFKCNTKAGLNNHKMTHVTERPLKCPFCPYSHHVYRSFKAHVNKHLGVKPFTCTHEGCDYATGYKNNLASHMRSKHPHQPKDETVKSQSLSFVPMAH